jgi:flagellin-like protein
VGEFEAVKKPQEDKTMRTPWLRPNKNAVSPVIGTILMVAITVVLAAVLYVMVTGLVTSPGQTKPTVTLSAGQWSGTSIVITITSVSTSTLGVSGLTYQVVGPTGTNYFNGAAGGPQGTANVTVTFNDAGGEGHVGADDNIAISVTTAANVQTLHGTTFRLLSGTDVLGTATVP